MKGRGKEERKKVERKGKERRKVMERRKKRRERGRKGEKEGGKKVLCLVFSARCDFSKRRDPS